MQLAHLEGNNQIADDSNNMTRSNHLDSSNNIVTAIAAETIAEADADAEYETEAEAEAEAEADAGADVEADVEQAQQQQLQLPKPSAYSSSSNMDHSNNRFKHNALKLHAAGNGKQMHCASHDRQDKSKQFSRKLQFGNSSNTITETIATTTTKPFNLNDVSSIIAINKHHNATSNSSSSSNNYATATSNATLTTIASRVNSFKNSNNLINVVPKTLTTPTRFIPAKPVLAKPAAVSLATTTTTATTTATAAAAAIAATGGVKRVNFDLPTTIDEGAEQDCDIDNDNDNDKIKSYSLALTRHNMNNNYNLSKGSSSSSKSKSHIVFNGTYPIDMPLGAPQQQQQQRNSYDAEANTDRSEMLRYRYMMHDYVINEDTVGEELAEDNYYDEDNDDDDDDDDDADADDDEYNEYDDYYVLQRNSDFLSKLGIIKRRHRQQQQQQQLQQQQQHHPRHPAIKAATATAALVAATPQHVWSMQELIANPAIPINYKKMCTEVEQSLSKFEAFLDAKKQATTTTTTTAMAKATSRMGVVRTFDIDAPTDDGNGGAGLALSTKKQL